jgi:hypothetical protein
MSIADDNDVQLHNSILGWLLLVGNAASLPIAACVFLLLSGIGLNVADPQARVILPVVGSSVGLLTGALALPGVVAGYALLKRKAWARMLAIVVGLLGVLNLPVGTAIALHALWVLLPTRTADYFAAVSSV